MKENANLFVILVAEIWIFCGVVESPTDDDAAN